MKTGKMQSNSNYKYRCLICNLNFKNQPEFIEHIYSEECKENAKMAMKNRERPDSPCKKSIDWSNRLLWAPWA